MKEPDLLSRDGRDYLTAVRAGLSDLDTEDRTDLLIQVEQRLVDLGRDGADRAAIELQLGRAEQFAADLRAAAGLPPLAEVARATPSTFAWLEEVAQRPGVQLVSSYLHELRPAWWAVRGYLLVALCLAALSSGGGYQLHTLGSYNDVLSTDGSGDRNPFGLMVTLAAVLASIVLGRATPRLPRWAVLLVIAANIAAAFTFFAYPTWWLAPAFRSFSGL